MIINRFIHGKNSVYYERVGERETHRIASVIATKSWGWTLLNLAWTVGPVTFIALQIGHFIGFGNYAPMKNFIYFASYTLIAGIFAVIATIIHETFYKGKIAKEQLLILDIIDNMHITIMAIRNTILSDLELNERKILAAFYLLQGAGATPVAIETAFMDLTQSKNLTAAARKSHIFNERGMSERVNDIFLLCQKELANVKEELETIAPQAYYLLENRLKGNVPKVKDGVERIEGFIERVLVAAEENNRNFMTFYDAMEMFNLGFELLNGRKIAMLSIRLKGESRLEDAKEKLDEVRHNYRIAIRRRNSKIRLLLERLSNETSVDLLAEATDTVDKLINAMKYGIKILPKGRRDIFKNSYLNIMSLNKEVHAQWSLFVKAEAKYRSNWLKYGKGLTLALETDDLGKAGFSIQENSIFLTDKQKIKFVRFLSDIFPGNIDEISKDQFKTMAMDIGNELDSLLDISQTEEQLAIESSNLANFGFITKDLTPKTKAGWAALAVDATHENRRKASHNLANSMNKYYNIPITEAIIDIFVNEFGSDIDYLQSLKINNTTVNDKDNFIPTPPRITPWSKLFTG